MLINSTKFSDFSNYLLKSKRIVIIPHKDADGDAIGASLAWYNTLIKRGFSAKVISPSALPGGFSWMSGFNDIIVYEDNPEASISLINSCDLLLLLDFNSISRAGNLASILNKSLSPRVLIDHHPYPEPGISDLLFSETSASSTCELSSAILEGLSFEISTGVAECLYAGIMTDTGTLSYNSSLPATYHVVASLISKGVDKEKIQREIFHNNPLTRIKLLGHALCNKLEVLHGLPVAFIALSKAELDSFNYRPGDTEGLVNHGLSVEGVNVSALFLQTSEKFIKASFRSRGDIAINRFSEQFFNGGGHHNAAGGEMRESLGNTIQYFQRSIKAYLNATTSSVL